MLQAAELVFKLPPPDTLAASPIAQGVSALDHELPDDTMEDGVVVVPALGMRHKVLNRLWRRVGEQPDMDVAMGRV